MKSLMTQAVVLLAFSLLLGVTGCGAIAPSHSAGFPGWDNGKKAAQEEAFRKQVEKDPFPSAK